MTVEELRWFVAVAEREHVTAAAAELHVSQPALSRALGRVQAHVGVPLFDRQGRNLRLNRYGRLYLERARRALAELDAGDAELAALRPGALVVDIASHPGGVDWAAARRRGVRAHLELGLPARFFPVTAGRILADCVERLAQGVPGGTAGGSPRPA